MYQLESVGHHLVLLCGLWRPLMRPDLDQSRWVLEKAIEAHPVPACRLQDNTEAASDQRQDVRFGDSLFDAVGIEVSGLGLDRKFLLPGALDREYVFLCPDVGEQAKNDSITSTHCIRKVAMDGSKPVGLALAIGLAGEQPVDVHSVCDAR